MLIETQICQEVKQLPIVAAQTKLFSGITSYCELDSIHCSKNGPVIVSCTQRKTRAVF